VKDPMMPQVQMAMFLKNISLLGSAFFFAQLGTGPLSLDSRGGAAR
jgi:putative oxidoreductase